MILTNNLSLIPHAPLLSSVSGQQQKSLSLEPSADSSVYVSPAELMTVNFGGDQFLNVASSLVTPVGEAVASFMFDLSELPPGAKVLSASFQVWGGGAQGTLDGSLGLFYFADNDWTEYGINGLKVTPPDPFAAQPTAAVKIVQGEAAKYTFDVTGDVRRALDHTQLALTEVLDFMFRALPGPLYMYFRSRENDVVDQRPKLVVTYTSTVDLTKAILSQAGTTPVVVITTSTEVQVNMENRTLGFTIGLKETRERGWARIMIDKTALFTNPYVLCPCLSRPRFYESPTQYILVVEYGKSVERSTIYIQSYGIGTFDAEGKSKRAFDLGDQVYVRGMDLFPYLGRRAVDIYLLADGAPLSPMMAVAKSQQQLTRRVTSY